MASRQPAFRRAPAAFRPAFCDATRFPCICAARRCTGCLRSWHVWSDQPTRREAMRHAPEEAERQAINALVDWPKARRRVAGSMGPVLAEAELDDAAVQIVLCGARRLPREH